MNEIWKDIKNYGGLYQISSLGRVRSLRKDQIMSECIKRCGYSHVSLTRDGKRKSFRVYRLVAEHFY